MASTKPTNTSNPGRRLTLPPQVVSKPEPAPEPTPQPGPDPTTTTGTGNQMELHPGNATSEFTSPQVSGFTSETTSETTSGWFAHAPQPTGISRESMILQAKREPRRETIPRGINPTRFLDDAVRLYADANMLKISAAYDRLIELALVNVAPDMLITAYANRADANGYPTQYEPYGYPHQR